MSLLKISRFRTSMTINTAHQRVHWIDIGIRFLITIQANKYFLPGLQRSHFAASATTATSRGLCMGIFLKSDFIGMAAFAGRRIGTGHGFQSGITSQKSNHLKT